MRHETWSYSSLLGLVNAQCIMHKEFQLYDFLMFDSTLVINQYIIPKVKQPIVFHFEAYSV